MTSIFIKRTAQCRSPRFIIQTIGVPGRKGDGGREVGERGGTENGRDMNHIEIEGGRAGVTFWTRPVGAGVSLFLFFAEPIISVTYSIMHAISHKFGERLSVIYSRQTEDERATQTNESPSEKSHFSNAGHDTHTHALAVVYLLQHIWGMPPQRLKDR